MYVQSFYSFLSELQISKRNIVLDNIITILSAEKIEYSLDDLPF